MKNLARIRNIRFILLLLGTVLVAAGLSACSSNPAIINFRKPPPHFTNSGNSPESKEAAAQTHTQLAVAYLHVGEPKTAEKALADALKFDPNYVPAHTILGVLYWRIGDLVGANKELQTAVNLDPKSGDAANNYGKFLCSQGHYQEAMGYFTKALADPFYKTPAVAAGNAGECEATHGDTVAAEGYLQKSLSLDPNFTPALLKSAELAYAQGQAFQAEGYMQRFRAHAEATPESLWLSYQVSKHLDQSDATKYLNQLQDKFPQSSEAAKARQVVKP